MNQTQSVIVYRNPAEQAFWESGVIIPLGGSLVVFLIVVMSLMRLVETKTRVFTSARKNSTISVFIIASIMAIATFNYLMI